jgi:hypothetical protein
MGPVSKLLSTGVGLTREYQARNRSKSPGPKNGEAEEEEAPPLHDSITDVQDEDILDTDQAQWALDELQNSPSDEADPPKDKSNSVDQILATFFSKNPTPPNISQIDLPFSVIIPQRRPGTKLSGFIHAYPPIFSPLIPESAWFSLLSGFTSSIKYSPVFHAVNGALALANLGLQAVAGPSLAAHAMAMAVHVSIEGMRRGYARYQGNKYLDGINEGYLRPRGLYALLWSFRPKSSKAEATVELSAEEKVEEAMLKRVEGGGRWSGVSGQAHWEHHLPEAMPLVFPDLDEDAQVEGGKKKFLKEYKDRRARARFAQLHPESKLNVLPKEEFASRYSDPSHPASNGNIVNFLSGGKIDRPNLKERRTIMKGMVTGKGRMSPAEARRELIEKESGRADEGKKGPVKGMVGAMGRRIHEDVVYLMVVNMPSEEELREIKALVEQRRAAGDVEMEE